LVSDIPAEDWKSVTFFTVYLVGGEGMICIVMAGHTAYHAKELLSCKLLANQPLLLLLVFY
jgi:hypothetical protein